jgi:AcrR family transcriptional regulator
MRRGELSRDLVVSTAMKIVEDRGIEHLSMRSLAAELGVAVTAIYWHVGSKEQLLEALDERIRSDVLVVHAHGATPEAKLLSATQSYFLALSTHRWLAGLAHQRGRLLDLLSPARVLIAELFTEAGLRPAEAANATNAVVQFVGDHVTAQHFSRTWPEQSLNPESITSDSLHRVTLARLRRAPDREEVFDHTARALIRGLLTKRGS